MLAFITASTGATRDQLAEFYEKYPQYAKRFDTVLRVRREYIRHLETYNSRLQLVLVTISRYLSTAANKNLTQQERTRLSRDRRTLRRMGVAIGPIKSRA